MKNLLFIVTLLFGVLGPSSGLASDRLEPITFTTGRLSPLPYRYSAVELEVVNLINQYRKQNQLTPLKLDDQLTFAAFGRANYIFQSQKFEHKVTGEGGFRTLSGADTYTKYPVLSENLGIHYKSASELVTAWINSPTHKAVLLRPATTTGIAVIPGTFDGYRTFVSVELYGE